MARVLVTGGTGFVGSAVVRDLLGRGEAVRAFHRAGANLSNLRGHEGELETCEGDLRDVESLSRAMDGCQRVFHVAARYQFGRRYAKDLHADNHDGTKNVLDAAKRVGVERVVYTSTVGVLHPRADGVPVDETALGNLEEMAGAYKASKWLAEQEVVKAAADGLPVVSVCPSTPIGHYDVKPTPTGQMILDFLLGKMPAYVDTGLNLVDVDDVAVGHWLAAEKGRVGERYILGGRDMKLREILECLAQITGGKAPRFKVPKKLLLPIAYLTEGFASVFGFEPRVTIENAKMSQVFMYFDSSKAKRELGYEPGSVEKGLERAVEWFRANGYVDKR
ncbi:MAG: hopanoid-associated sugar epimerase [Planctomycetota bacterium]